MLNSETMRIERARRKWSQKRLAKEAGVSIPTIIRMEKDDLGSNQTSINKVMVALGLTKTEEKEQ